MCQHVSHLTVSAHTVPWPEVFLPLSLPEYSLPFISRVSLPQKGNHLSIDVSGVLKTPTIFVLKSISTFMSFHICFMYLAAPIFTVVVSPC